MARRKPTDSTSTDTAEGTNQEQENAVQDDTATIDETTTPESTEPTAEATESTTEAQAPAEPEGPPAEEVLANAVAAAISGADAEGNLNAETIEPLRQAYKKVPAAKRGAVQAEIMGKSLADPNVNHQALANVLTEMVQAPAKTQRTRTPREEVPADQQLAKQLAVLEVARQAILESVEDAEVRSQGITLAEGIVTGSIEDEGARNAFLAQVAKAVKATEVRAPRASSGGGGGGDRKSYSTTLASLIEAGTLPVGTVLTNAKKDLKAEVVEGGKLRIANGEEYDSPSTAATKSGVGSVNGWEFWKLEDGKSLGSLRG